MSEQVGQYRCFQCGESFPDAVSLSSHVETHQGAEFRTGPAERKDLSQAYAHADREFSGARVPLFGITLLFLLAFAYAMAFHVALFAPLFVAATGAMIVAAGFLFKYLMEG